MDFSHFDERRYPTSNVVAGYGEWSESYENTVLDLMDLALLERLETPAWKQAGRIADLACGTGRVGVWLKGNGARAIDGVDITPEMLALARSKSVYDRLVNADVATTGLASAEYDIATMSLADEHFRDLGPAYREAARLLGAGGAFVIVGYHCHFLMTAGMPTHFNNRHGEPVAVQTYVHLFSDHVAAARKAGLQLLEMVEGLVNDDWIAAKPKWERFRHHPVSFAMAWRKA